MPRSPVTDFDTSVTTVGAVASVLRGQEFRALGNGRRAEVFGPAVLKLPPRMLAACYSRGGWLSATPAGRLAEMRAEDVARHFLDAYPARSYPAVLIGSSGGAVAHLGALLGAPWLPQTFLVPVRRAGVDVDDTRRLADWARGRAEAPLAKNPELALHHAADPSHDRLMLAYMAYFRFKWLRLAAAYRAFIGRTLPPGGTVIIVDCRLRWPTTRFGERHVFQHGGAGGLTIEEYRGGGPRVSRFLEREGSRHRRWDPPEADGSSPEAEWGYADELTDDLAALARERRLHLLRLTFEDPEDLSASVADAFGRWHRSHGTDRRRLLAQSYMQVTPRAALTTGSVPFWCTFTSQPSAAALERFVDRTGPWDEIYVNLFSNGLEYPGIASAERWRGIAAKARRRGALVGVDASRYPRDFAASVRYTEIERLVEERLPVPSPVPVSLLGDLLGPSATLTSLVSPAGIPEEVTTPGGAAVTGV